MSTSLASSFSSFPPRANVCPIPENTPASFALRPSVVVWELTRACALACRHCRACAVSKRDPAELNIFEALDLIENLQTLGPDLLILTGGDPMMRRDLPDIIRAASRKSLRVVLSPSATPRLVRADFKGLRQAGLTGISLSVDGANRVQHDAFRGVPGTWERTWAAMIQATHVGLPVQINTTLSKENIRDFDELRALIEKVHPSAWTLFVVVPTGRAAADSLPDAEDVEEVLQKLWKMSREVDFRIRTTEAQHFRRIAVQNGAGASLSSPSMLPTNAGRGFMFISHTGEICPSGFLPIITGNVRENDLREVYRHHPLFVNLRDASALKGKCGRCRYNALCGGSRARAFALTGDPFAEDPLCSHQPALLS